MKQFSLFILFLFFALLAQAQYTSRLGRFKVDQIRGCAPFTMNITNANLITVGECAGGKPCLMDYLGNNPSPPTNLFTFTYNTPGTYKLSVLYQSIGIDDIMITVDPNVSPSFEIYSCAGSKVSINITDKTYDTYAIDFNNDGIIDTVIPSGNNQIATFNYGAPVSTNIKVQGKKLNAANNCTINLQPFTALPTLPFPSINTLLATDAATLQLAFTPQTNIQYHTEIAFNNSSNFQLYQTLYNVSALTAPNLAVDKNYYCFRLSSFDPCANANTYSVPVCSHNFNVTTASGVDQLAWQTSSTGIANIQVNRNNSLLTTLPGSSTLYNDNAVVCKTNYCYQLVSRYVGGATSTSLQKCVDAFLTATPTAINNTSAVVNNNSQVDLVWLQDPAFTAAGYSIFRSQNKSAYVLLNNTTATQFTDAAYAQGNCYRINYTDLCDNASLQGKPSCSIWLSGMLDDTNDVILLWSGYKGWNLGVNNYVIQKFNQQGQLLQTINAATDTTYTDSQQDLVNQVVFYKITAYANESGVSISVSNEIKIVKNINLFSPTAFNPESKTSVNKTFFVRGHFISKMEIEIFDRWGSLVFYSEKNEAWDGRRDGGNMPDASYVWSAKGTDLNGNSFKKSGTVVLIRK